MYLPILLPPHSIQSYIINTYSVRGSLFHTYLRYFSPADFKTLEPLDLNCQIVQCNVSSHLPLHFSEEGLSWVQIFIIPGIVLNCIEANLWTITFRGSTEIGRRGNAEGEDLHSLFEIEFQLILWLLNFSLRSDVDLWFFFFNHTVTNVEHNNIEML